MSIDSADTSAYRRALGERIAEVVAKYPTKAAACRIVGITTEQLSKWVAGEVKVPVDALHRWAIHLGIDFCWLTSGENRASPIAATPVAAVTGPRVIQEAALRVALAALCRTANETDVVFAPDRFADLALALHDYVVAKRDRSNGDAQLTADDVAAMTNLIKLAAR